MAMGSNRINRREACELFEAVSTPDEDHVPTIKARDHIPTVQVASTTAGKSRGITAEMLSKIWRIDHKMAEKTLQLTTQLNRVGADGSSLSRHFGTNDRNIRYRRIKSWFYTDTLFVTGKAKSTRGHSCMQLFVSDKGYVKVFIP